MSLREESDEFTRVRSALPCVSEGALEIALLLSTASKVVEEPTYGELAARHVKLITDGSRNHVHSFWKAFTSLQVARLCEAQAIISPRLHRDGPPIYSVNDAPNAFDYQHDLDGPWRERQREVGDCGKGVSSRKGCVLGECRECAGAR